MNTVSKNVRQLGRKQEHFRRIRKLKLQLPRVNANSVWKNFSVVKANAKILGQSNNGSYVQDNKCNSGYKR